ncbi:MAG TPA: T9SS type A sorting domain-containing protein, partial [Candidatus Kapabacteria bacterium]
YSHSINLIYALQFGGGFWRSFDSGFTWQQMVTPFLDPGSFDVRSDGSICVFDMYARAIFQSVDSGQTWTEQAKGLGGDDWTLVANPSDNASMYFTVEPAALYSTTNGGATWKDTNTDVEGSIAIVPCFVFAGTEQHGILRSSNSGISWQSIGGPNVNRDNRMLCAIDPNLVFAIDPLGNIWATNNSGGDSVRASVFSASPDTLFQADTLLCDSLTRSVHFSISGCTPSSVSGWSIFGPDSGNFGASDLSNDSILVTLHRNAQGAQNAKLVLSLDNGSRDTIALSGYVSSPNSTIHLRTSNIITHAGDTISIPVYLSGNASLGATSIMLPFGIDTNILRTIGFDSTISGITVGALTYSGSTGTVLLQDSGLTLSGDTIIGYLRCVVYLADTIATTVTLQNPTLNSAAEPCNALSLTTDSVHILIAGCGDKFLLQFMKTGTVPLAIQSIVPDPASSLVGINFFNPTNAAISYQVIDALGETRLRGMAGTNALALDVSRMPAGMYFIRASTENGVFVARKFAVVR